MSYEIMYDRRFIRTSRGIVPMILSGSNNCTEQHWDCRGRSYERRERHWWAWIPSGKIIKDLPEADLLTMITKLCEDADPNRELFKRNGAWLTYGQWYTWFQNGCKAAREIQEYLAWDRTQSFEGSLRVYADKKSFSSTEELWTYIHTTEELEKWLDEADKRRAEICSELGNACEVYVHLRFSGNRPLNVPAKPVEGPVVAKRQTAFVKEYEKGKRLTFTYDPAEAAVFPDIEAARDALGVAFWNSCRFVSAKKQLRPMDHVIQMQSGKLAGSFIRKKTKGYLFPSRSIDDAKRFPNRNAAIKFATETRMRFNIGDTILLHDLKNGTQEEVRIREEVA